MLEIRAEGSLDRPNLVVVAVVAVGIRPARRQEAAVVVGSYRVRLGGVAGNDPVPRHRQAVAGANPRAAGADHSSGKLHQVDHH